MEKDDNLSSLTETFRQVVSTMLLSEAVFDILVEKRILSGEEVLERVKKLKSQTPTRYPSLIN